MENIFSFGSVSLHFWGSGSRSLSISVLNLGFSEWGLGYENWSRDVYTSYYESEDTIVPHGEPGSMVERSVWRMERLRQEVPTTPVYDSTYSHLSLGLDGGWWTLWHVRWQRLCRTRCRPSELTRTRVHHYTTNPDPSYFPLLAPFRPTPGTTSPDLLRFPSLLDVVNIEDQYSFKGQHSVSFGLDMSEYVFLYVIEHSNLTGPHRQKRPVRSRSPLCDTKILEQKNVERRDTRYKNLWPPFHRRLSEYQF